MPVAQSKPISARGSKILVVDDDPIVCEVLERYLRREGFDVSAAADGGAALSAVRTGAPDLVLLDLMLPHLDGLEVFRRIRSGELGSAEPAVIMLTAKGSETDRIVGLESGADDYVAKPFSPREVVARVWSVLRRTLAEKDELADEELVFGELRVDPVAREASVGGDPAELTPKEFDLLCLFARNPRVAFSRTRLLDELWDLAYEGDPSTVTVHVRRLRQKIEPDPSHPRHLVTVWGAGYRFEP